MKYFQGARYYFILEEEERLKLISKKNRDALAFDRLNFKIYMNEIFFRIAEADFFVTICFQALKKFQKQKQKLFSAEETLESIFVNNSLEKYLINIAEIIDSFCKFLRTWIPSQYNSLFRKLGKRKLSQVEENIVDKYQDCFNLLFPKFNIQRTLSDDHFHSLADRLDEILVPLKAFRDRVLAHPYDKKRHETFFSYQQYSDIITEIKKLLRAVSIVSTLKLIDNDWEVYKDKQIYRFGNWLDQGLSESLFKFV